MLVTGRERGRQDESARGDPRRDAGLLAAHALGCAADPARRDGSPDRPRRATAARVPVTVSVWPQRFASRSGRGSTAPPCARPSSCAASSRRSSSHPTGSSSSKAALPRGGRTRPLARAAVPGPRAPARGLRRGRRAAQRRPPPRRGRRISGPRCSRRGRRRSRTSGAMLTAARRDAIELLQPGFAERAGELGLPAASLGYDAEPPTDRRRWRRGSTQDLERGTTGPGPPGRDRGPLRRPRPAHVRLPGRAAARRAGAAARRGGAASRRAAACRRCCCSTTRFPSSTSAAPDPE